MCGSDQKDCAGCRNEFALKKREGSAAKCVPQEHRLGVAVHFFYFDSYTDCVGESRGRWRGIVILKLY